MTRRPGFVTALALFAHAALGGAAQSQTAQQGAPAAAEPPANATPAAYVLSMGDMMNTLVQPRHTKLGLAAHAENWPLAQYALVEIKQVFARIGKAQPRFRGMPVPDLVEAALSQPISALEIAIKQKDPQRFAAAYDQLTQGCNACHITTDHPYVVIKLPDTSAFPDQDFSPRR